MGKSHTQYFNLIFHLQIFKPIADIAIADAIANNAPVTATCDEVVVGFFGEFPGGVKVLQQFDM